MTEPAPRIAGVRLASGAPLTWCTADADLQPGVLVAVETVDGQHVGRVVVAPHQLLQPTPVQPSGRVLHLATDQERAAWEAARFQPQAGKKLLQEIQQRPPGAPTG